MEAQTSATLAVPNRNESMGFWDVLIEKARDATGLWSADDRAFTGRGSWKDIVPEP